VFFFANLIGKTAYLPHSIVEPAIIVRQLLVSPVKQASKTFGFLSFLDLSVTELAFIHTSPPLGVGFYLEKALIAIRMKD
jgi:hypothetical protein